MSLLSAIVHETMDACSQFLSMHILKKVAKTKEIYPSGDKVRTVEFAQITTGLGDFKTGKPENQNGI